MKRALRTNTAYFIHISYNILPEYSVTSLLLRNTQGKTYTSPKRIILLCFKRSKPQKLVCTSKIIKDA